MPLRGQPRNIEELTMDMITRYITGDSKVILCAIPANTDFVTSAAVKLASTVDPQGVRTLGVVTKIDQSTGSIKRKLEGLDGSDVSLKLGFVAVRPLPTGSNTKKAMPGDCIQKLDIFMSLRRFAYCCDQSIAFSLNCLQYYEKC